MTFSSLLTIVLVVLVVAFNLGYSRARAFRTNGGRINALPFYHGSWLVICTLLPALALLLVRSIVDGYVIKASVLSQLPETLVAKSPQQQSLVYTELVRLAAGNTPYDAAHPLAALADRYTALASRSQFMQMILALLLLVAGAAYGWLRISPTFNARTRFENVVRFALLASASLAIFTTVGIVFSVLFEALRFFDTVSIFEFVFGTHWSPQMAIRADQVGSSGAFGATELALTAL